MENINLISLVICTYNRKDLLHSAIESIVAQEDYFPMCELLVIDNNSTDGTNEILEGYVNRYKNIRYIFEKCQGLSYARNRGICEAVGDYVVYIDDDCILPDGYLQELNKVILDKEPRMFGGPSIAFFDFPKPLWVKREYYSDFQDRPSGSLKKGEVVYGMNMGFSRNLFDEIGGFNTSLGMKGKELAYAEEVELQYRAIEMDPQMEIYFDSKLWLYHQVRREKVNLNWLLKYYYLTGLKGIEGFNAIQAINRMPIHLRIARFLCILGRIIYHFLRIIVKFIVLITCFFRKSAFWQQYLVERIFSTEVKKIGILFAEIMSIGWSFKDGE